MPAEERRKTLRTNYFKYSALLNRQSTLLLPLILPFFTLPKLPTVQNLVSSRSSFYCLSQLHSITIYIKEIFILFFSHLSHGHFGWLWNKIYGGIQLPLTQYLVPF